MRGGGGPAAVRSITHGTINVGRGAEGVKLDMTRGQVIATIGMPLDENPLGTMSYAPESANGPK